MEDSRFASKTSDSAPARNARTGLFRTISWSVVIIGMLARLIVFLQNRYLIIDEANVARNLHERSFSALLEPLSYEQYAPPLFLFICKLNMMLYGAYEWALRLFPAICGLLSLPVMYYLLRKADVKKAAFYPLAILATGGIYLRHTTELKQYSSDVLVALLLLLLALLLYPTRTKPLKLAAVWMLAGSVAILLSMPSVFMLAGVGLYYFAAYVSGRDMKSLTAISVAVLTWLSVFALQYFLLLKPSINSSYLQNYHQQNFLHLLPSNGEMLSYNINSLETFFSHMGGQWVLSMGLHLLMLAIGFVKLYQSNRGLFLLLAVPLLALLIAAGLHQFVLVPRVVLFIYPILLIAIGVGLEQCFTLRYRKLVLPPLVLILMVNMYNFNALSWLTEPVAFDHVPDNLQWAEARKVTGENVYIHDTGKPQWIYYTTIHPDRSKFTSFKLSRPFLWNTNLDSVAAHATVPTVFIYSSPNLDEMNSALETIRRHMIPADSMISQLGGYAYLFVPQR